MGETFDILGRQIIFSDGHMRFHELRTIYSEKAVEYYNKFKEKYDSYGDIETVCKNAADFCIDMMVELSRDYASSLVQRRIYDVDANIFLSKYGEYQSQNNEKSRRYAGGCIKYLIFKRIYA